VYKAALICGTYGSTP